MKEEGRARGGGPAATKQIGYDKEISSIQTILQKYDRDGLGALELSEIPNLLTDLGRDVGKVEEVLALLHEVDEERTTAGFEEIVQALKQVEQVGFEKITTPLALMRRLEQYRRQCEGKGDYKEARKAKTKFEELRTKEQLRQRRLIEQAQIHEMTEVEAAQKQQFLEFSAAWDRYMADYESTAYMSLERLKEQHAQEFSQLSDQIQKQPRVCKFSPELLELRRKQKALAKLGKYEDANQIKARADKLEKWEIAKYASQTVDSVQRLEEKLRTQQNKALNALLKRIQRDRGEQIRHRQLDSHRLMQRNKNLRQDLEKKQHLEFIRAEAAIKSILGNPEHAEKLLESQDAGFLEKLGIGGGAAGKAGGGI